MNPGDRLGPYEITAPIGAGGMGEVYRAHDARLNRDVAIKVLPPALANDADYLARFQREAQALAALNHLNIAQVYGLEQNAIVMELVDGDTLQTPQPLDDALAIARQIAEALEAAHDKGIIHRDLKPGNIKITPEGIVKVLDFGLAKTAEPTSSVNVENSPTLTLRATQAGIIIGTAAYMSPAQAAGKHVDRRSDIWSFGVVLWEMLAGKRLFDGETVSHTLADVLRAPIDLAALPSATPARIRELVGRCLDRNVKTRLQSIAEARIAIDNQIAHPEASAAPPTVRATRWPALAAAVFFAAAAVAGIGWYRAARPIEQPLTRFTADLGAGLVIRDSTGGPTSAVGPACVISPDGRRIAFLAAGEGRPVQLFTRRLNEPEPTLVAGAEGAESPFFSPDGQWIGFFSGGKLKKVRVDGGVPTPLADGMLPMGASWGDDGSIIASIGLGSTLVRIRERGGPPEPVTRILPDRENAHRWPQVLPGAKAVLFSAGRGGDFENGEIAAVRFSNGERKTVQRAATFGRYHASGHITFVSRNTLFAAPFDPERLEITGPIAPVLNDIRYARDSGGAQFDVSRTGAALYRTGVFASEERFVVLIDEQGNASKLLAVRGVLQYPTLSPDGSRLAIQITDGTSQQIWVHDLRRRTGARLTFSAGVHFRPRWTHDSRRVLYSNPHGLYWVRADGSGPTVQLVKTNLQRPMVAGITPDGKRLVYSPGARSETPCMFVSLSGDPEQPDVGQPERCFSGNEDAFQPELSPDGRWLAYVSNEGGRSEIFVRSFPDRGGRWQVSRDGGTRAAWSPDGRHLFFQSLTEELMVAGYSVSGSSINFEPPRQWTKVKLFSRSGFDRQYSIAPDGKHVAIIADDEGGRQADAHVVVLLNFFDEIRRRIAGGAQ